MFHMNLSRLWWVKLSPSCPAELRAVSPELQAPRNRAEPSVGPNEPPADPDLPAVQPHQRETRPGPEQQEGQRQRGRRGGTRYQKHDNKPNVL